MVCVAPGHPKGTADYARFVRKHRNYYAPTAKGEILSGVSHVHLALSPYGPPDSSEFDEINNSMLSRVYNREGAYDLWDVGKPYENKEIRTVRIRPERSLGTPGRRLLRHSTAHEDRAVPVGWREAEVARVLGFILAATSVASVYFGTIAGLSTVAIAALGIGILTAGIGTIAVATRRIKRRIAAIVDALRQVGTSDCLEDLGLTVAVALRDAGAISKELGEGSVRTVIQDDGYYRCYLAGASTEESQLFAEALNELLSPLSSPRYIIPRYVHHVPLSQDDAARMVRLWVRTERLEFEESSVVYHQVPSYLAVNRDRVELFRRAWNRYVSDGEPLFHQTPEAYAIIQVQDGADPFDVTTQMRTLWR